MYLSSDARARFKVPKLLSAGKLPGIHRLIGRPRACAGGISVPFFNDPLLGSWTDDRNLVRRGRHSIQRERRSSRALLDTAQAEDRDLERADWETGKFVLR